MATAALKQDALILTRLLSVSGLLRLLTLRGFETDPLIAGSALVLTPHRAANRAGWAQTGGGPQYQIDGIYTW